MDSSTPVKENELVEQVQSKYKSLNQSITDKVNHVLNNNEPTADIWQKLRKIILDYRNKETRSMVFLF